MKDLPAQLNRFSDIKHAIYADNITIWTTRGSPAQVEEAPQQSAEVMERYASCGGLACSAEKSELLVVTKHNSKQ